MDILIIPIEDSLAESAHLGHEGARHGTLPVRRPEKAVSQNLLLARLDTFQSCCTKTPSGSDELSKGDRDYVFIIALAPAGPKRDAPFVVPYGVVEMRVSVFDGVLPSRRVAGVKPEGAGSGHLPELDSLGS
ncbi:hypothetical protein ACJZ2D_016663 [Fusarium nematophilum]